MPKKSSNVPGKAAGSRGKPRAGAALTPAALRQMADALQQGNFFNFAADLSDFSDTAALIENLDIVVSVDTATAHLAAALGKPTWILNRFDSCWRWLYDRDDSPWYPTVRLYRQQGEGPWGPILDAWLVMCLC